MTESIFILITQLLCIILVDQYASDLPLMNYYQIKFRQKSTSEFTYSDYLLVKFQYPNLLSKEKKHDRLLLDFFE